MSMQYVIPKTKYNNFDIKLSELDTSTASVGYANNQASANYTTLASTYLVSKYLYVPIVPQNGLPICWAAAVASIGNSKTSQTRTAEYVSNYIYGQNQGGNTYVALLALQGIYDIGGIDLYSAPSFNTIKSEIMDNDPIYVRLYGTSSSGTLNHALTIIGYYDYTGSNYDGKLRYNDTNASTYSHLLFTTSGSYKIVYNGITSYIDQYVKID